jgi:hypothetical protein
MGSPTTPEPTLGAPSLFILNDLLQYICKCTQMHKSTISKKMNLLYIAMDPSLYTHLSANKAYPYADYPFPNKNVDEVPSIATCNNNKEHTAAIITHTILLTTLIDTLLSLTPTVFKLLYEQKRMMNPNSVFF